MEQMQNPNPSIQSNKTKKNPTFLILLLLLLLISTGLFSFKDKFFLPESEIENKDSQQGEFVEKEDNDFIKTSDEERKADLNEIKIALKAYYNNNDNKYIISNEFTKLNNRDSFIYKELLKYANEESLEDPKYPEFYYGYKSDGNYYELSARLENLEDKECEFLNDELCIYKKKIDNRVLTTTGLIGFAIDNSFEYEEFIMVTSDFPNDIENELSEKTLLDIAPKIKKKASEITKEERYLNNFHIVGNIDTNNFLQEIYNKTVVVDVLDEGNFSVNKSVMKFAENPWNKDKIIIITETNYSPGATINAEGKIIVEKNNGFYHIIFNTSEDESYALVPNLELKSRSSNLVQFNDKYVKISGYKRIRDSKEFPIENSIGVMSIEIIE